MRKNIKYKLYFVIWASTLTMILVVFFLIQMLMINWYKESQIDHLKKDLEETTTLVASYRGQDVNELINYIDDLAVLYSNDLRPVVVIDDDIIDIRTKLPFVSGIDTRDILKLESGECYYLFHGDMYYCFSKTNLYDSGFSIFILDSAPYSYITTHLEDATYNLIVTVIFSILFSVVITYFYSKRLTKPISKVVEESHKILDDDYIYNPIESRIEEISNIQSSLLKLQNRLIMTENLEKEFLSGISHELKSELSIIKSYAEMIKDFSIDDKDLILEHLDIIEEQTDVMVKHIDDVNVISKVKLNAYNDKLKINGYQMISNIVNCFNNKGINVCLEMEESLVFNANPLCIKYCFTNYISNAFKYTKDYIKISLYKKDKLIYFIVENNGDKIEEADINNIWEYYYKGDNSINGSGLGLAIVKTICEHCDYKYNAESNENLTKFSIIIIGE